MLQCSIAGVHGRCGTRRFDARLKHVSDKHIHLIRENYKEVRVSMCPVLAGDGHYGCRTGAI